MHVRDKPYEARRTGKLSRNGGLIMVSRQWAQLVGAVIPVVWIWFALIGIRWNFYVSLFIAIAVTIFGGTFYNILLSSSGNGKK